VVTGRQKQGLSLLRISCNSSFSGVRERRFAFFLLLALWPTQAAAQNSETPIRGVIRAVEQAVISTELQAIAERVHFKEGDRFNQGDFLIEFDCRRQRADLRSAEAVSREMASTYNSNLVLKKHNAIASHDVEVSRLRAEKAAAEVESLQVLIASCEVRAPFRGRVSELAIRAHEAPVPNKPFMQIINDTALEVELIVPSAWLKWIKSGSKLTFTVDETKVTYPASISRVGAAVDPVSQTVKVVATFLSTDAAVLAGMSGDAIFENAHP
jgi:membrane fusion protein, multidrug efflux system